MKLTELLIVTWCSLIVARSETVETEQEELLRRAAQQLERLEAFRRPPEIQEKFDPTIFIGELENPISQSLLEIWKTPVDQNHLDETKSEAEQSTLWDELEPLPEETESDVTKQVLGNEKLTGVITGDPKYAAMMQERIKRGYNAGSASLLTGIAGGLISGVASASSASAAKASASSSETAYKPTYAEPPVHTVEHTYSYDEKPFGPWDFKKAIFSTLVQALKAIGGGVLALKGQLVKGSGYLLAGKGKVVSKAGDYITSFGKQLAASAVVEPKPYPPETYYDHPSVQGHNSDYQGPPPSSDDYSDYTPHETYGGVPSDDSNQGGLLIVTPTKSDLDEHNDQHTNVVAQDAPDPPNLDENFGGPTKSSAIKNLLSSVPKGSGSKDQTVVSQDNSNVNTNSPIQQYPTPTYGTPDHYITNQDNPAQNYNNDPQDYAQNYNNNPQDYAQNYNNNPQDYAQNYPVVQNNAYLPPYTTTVSQHHFPNFDNPKLIIQPNVEYPPLQQLDYPLNPNPLVLNPPKLPHEDDGGTSMYASLNIDTKPQIAPLKISLLGDHSNALHLPKLQPHVDFHGQSQLANPLHDSLSGPLRIPFLNPVPTAYHWHSQGLFVPSPLTTLDHYPKRNVLQKRQAIAKRLARYSSLQRLQRFL
ncbi:uncharacterized protein LOC109856258 isoform X2 [Pseudomyrmex gracilis]|uniref:uncharacterized protein LOC109856258 isoform X2 n=1 Tax=Pseudomyrmex gracilis TaxID=219809 RepID=UPI0009958A05|nr:uncharacterized protein LOC109856258 isoform X2 [Pseudomyrmex gracilis]